MLKICTILPIKLNLKKISKVPSQSRNVAGGCYKGKAEERVLIITMWFFIISVGSCLEFFMSIS